MHNMQQTVTHSVVKSPPNDLAETDTLPQPTSFNRPMTTRIRSWLLRLLMLGGLIGLIVANMHALFPTLQKETTFMLQNPELTASQKLKLQNLEVPVYELVEIMVQTTPPTSTILIPIASEVEFGSGWPGLANGFLMQGYLYPRNLIAISNADWEAKWQGTTQPDVYVLVFSYQGFGGQVRTWPSQSPADQDVIYVGPSKWSYAPATR